MTEGVDIQEYMKDGIEQLVKDTLKAVFRNPKEAAFMGRFGLACAAAAARREKLEEEGLHMPAFLIASITSSCNLHCAGCYSRAGNATSDCMPESQLTADEWERIFREADGLGVSFILLAGGEPMLRRDVIKKAGEIRNILFPIFTNGTYMDDRYFEILDESRNLVPVMSIEGGREETDLRRGKGVYDRLMTNMERLSEKGLIFGASVTVTKKNIEEVLSDDFLDMLESKGCKAVFFIEYVPVSEDTKDLAPGEEERALLESRLSGLRETRDGMIYVSFPGDEKASGGCLAAGRGFFHINSHGGAEPCPFSQYSDINVKDTSLKEAAKSGLFTALRDGGLLEGDHTGGCVLFEKKEQVEAALKSLKEQQI